MAEPDWAWVLDRHTPPARDDFDLTPEQVLDVLDLVGQQPVDTTAGGTA